MTDCTLDTNTIIYYLKEDYQAISILEKIFVSQSLIYVSTVTELELFSLSKLSVQEIAKIESFLLGVTVLVFDSKLARLAGMIRRSYLIKPLDAAIAATAISTNSTLITHNIADFKKIPNLKIIKI